MLPAEKTFVNSSPESEGAEQRYLVFLTTSPIWGRSGIKELCLGLNATPIDITLKSSPKEPVQAFDLTFSELGFSSVCVFAHLVDFAKVLECIPSKASILFVLYCREEQELAYFSHKKETLFPSDEHSVAIFLPRQSEWANFSPLITRIKPVLMREAGAIDFMYAWREVLLHVSKKLKTSKNLAVQSAAPSGKTKAEVLPLKSSPAQASASIQPSITHVLGEDFMATVTESLKALMDSVDGDLACALGDYTSGMMLGGVGSAVNLEVAVAGNSEVIRAKMKTMKSLGLNDKIEDILITLGNQYHIIRLMSQKQGLFLYLVLDKSKANLAMARFKISETESSIVI